MKYLKQRFGRLGGKFIGLVLIEVGMILILITQSFPSSYRLFPFWTGIILLLIGLLFFIKILISQSL